MPDDEPTAAPATKAGAADNAVSISDEAYWQWTARWHGRHVATIKDGFCAGWRARGEHDTATPGQPPQRPFGTFANNYCGRCGVQLAPDDFDGICSECDHLSEDAGTPGEVERLRRTLTLAKDFIKWLLTEPPISTLQAKEAADGVIHRINDALAATAPHSDKVKESDQ